MFIRGQSMIHNLFVNYYIDKNSARQWELDLCILENIKIFDNVIIIISEFDLLVVCDEIKNNTIQHVMNSRPTFSDYFKMTEKFKQKDDLNVIANSDIIIPLETLVQSRKYFEKEKTCLSLTRWDVQSTGDLKFYNKKDSQDAWIFIGAANIPILSYGPGTAGCDNALSHVISDSGYKVINPSLTLKTLHIHVAPVRHYKDYENVVPKPYLFLQPTH